MAARHDGHESVPVISPGTPAPRFALRDTPHSRVTLDDYRGRPVILVFYVADWHPVATSQLSGFQVLLPEVARLGAAVLGLSSDGVWSHDAFGRANGLTFPLLADDEPPGAVSASYGLRVSESGRSTRGLIVVDGDGLVRWSSAFPDAVDPGVDGVVSVLEWLVGADAQAGPDERHSRK